MTNLYKITCRILAGSSSQNISFPRTKRIEYLLYDENRKPGSLAANFKAKENRPAFGFNHLPGGSIKERVTYLF